MKGKYVLTSHNIKAAKTGTINLNLENSTNMDVHESGKTRSKYKLCQRAIIYDMEKKFTPSSLNDSEVV